MKASLRIRQLANAVNLSTGAGLLLAALTRTPVETGPDGLLFGTGYRSRLPLAGAFTVGNVILYRGSRAFIDSRPDLLRHEAAHATQYAWCLGLPFLPLYAVAAAWSWWRTGDPGSRNVFERGAGLAIGGYQELPTVQRLAGPRNLFRTAAFSKYGPAAPSAAPSAAADSAVERP